MDKDIKTYTVTRRKGIDDLLCEWAFTGNSQGDESYSNDVEVYKSSQGWMSFNFKAPILPTDQESIYIEVERRRKLNLLYIQELKDKGEFGKEFPITMHLKHNSIFDAPLNYNKYPLESHRVVFLDDLPFK